MVINNTIMTELRKLDNDEELVIALNGLAKYKMRKTVKEFKKIFWENKHKIIYFRGRTMTEPPYILLEKREVK